MTQRQSGFALYLRHWLAFLFICASAQADDSQSPLARLKAHKGVQDVQLSFTNGQVNGPIFIQGLITPPPLKSLVQGGSELASPEQQARGFLLSHGELWGIERNEQLILLATKQDARSFTHLTFGRAVGPWPLATMQLMVHIDTAGNIIAVNGNVLPLSPELDNFIQHLDLSTVLKTEQLVERLPQSFSAGESVKILHSQVVAENESPFLIWQCDVLVVSSGQRFDLALNAQTGELVRKKLRLHVQELHHGKR